MCTSHHSRGSIACQEAHMGLEAQKHYSSLHILLAAQKHLVQKTYCPMLYWFHSASAQGSTRGNTISSSTIFCSRTRRCFFFLCPNMNKSVEMITLHILLMLLNTFLPTLYELCLYRERIVVVAGYNSRFI